MNGPITKLAPSAAVADAELARVLERYLADLEAGRAIGPEQLCAEHPAIAERLRACLGSLQFVEGAADAIGGLSRSPDPVALGQIGEFRILREIGRGGMGVVYEAEQASLGRRVALKVLPFAAMLDQRALARFKNEALAAALIDHPHIVDIYAVGCDRGVHYYAMRLVDGQTLARHIENLRIQKSKARSQQVGVRGQQSKSNRSADDPKNDRGCRQGLSDPFAQTTQLPAVEVPSPVSTVKASLGKAATSRALSPALTPGIATYRAIAGLAIQAAEALEHAHQCGVIHRDIKPANLLLDNDGNLWITDFGLALLQSDAHLTMTGELLGTPRYMSPEQVLGKRGTVDPRSDVYSLGATLYELLTLAPAFDAQSRVELLRQIAADDPPALRQHDREIPADLETIVLKAMSKRPEDRYASAQDLADDLHRHVEHKPIAARRPSPLEKLAKWSYRHRPVVAASLLVLIVCAIALAVSTISIARQRNLAVLARDDATTQGRRAEQNFQRAREAVEQMLSRVAQEDLAHVPQMEPIRRKLLEDALQFQLSFLQENGNRSEVRHDAARAQMQVADIYRLLGVREKAEPAYAESIRLLSKLASESARPEYRRDLASSQMNLGNLLLGASRFVEADAAYTRALSLRKALAAELPNGLHRSDLAAIHMNLSNVQLKTNRKPEAIENLCLSLALREKLVKEYPDEPSYAMGLAASIGNLSVLQWTEGKRQKAVEGTQRTAELYAAILERHPDRFDCRQQLGSNSNNLAGMLLTLRRFDEAERAYRTSIENFKELAADFPATPNHRHSAGSGHHQLGLLLAQMGKHKQAEAEYREALALREKLTSEFPKEALYRSNLATTCTNLAALLGNANRLPEAEPLRMRAVSLYEKLAGDSPQVVFYRRELASSRMNLGYLYWKDQRPAEAEPLLKQALSDCEALTSELPNVADYKKLQDAVQLGLNQLQAQASRAP